MIPYSPSSTFHGAISLVDTTDVVMGGVSGTANVATKELANNTRYLSEHFGRVGGVVEIDNTGSSISLLAAALYNRVLRISLVNPNNMEVTLPDAAGLVEGSVTEIYVHGSHADKCVKLMTPWIFQTIRDGVAEYQYLYLYRGESIRLVVNNTQWEVLGLRSNQYRVGEMVTNYRVMPGALLKNGQLVNRADYPRLWEFLSGIGSQAVLLSDANWLNNSTKTNFSTGNGTTTFRVPYEQYSGTGLWPHIIY